MDLGDHRFHMSEVWANVYHNLIVEHAELKDTMKIVTMNLGHVGVRVRI